MRSAVVTLLALSLAGPAFANGRFPATTSLATRPGTGADLGLGVTFGLLVSHDSGQHFYWVCEEAIGFSGTFDPDFEIAPNGDLWATTFKGLRVSGDGGCTWNLVTDGLDAEAWISEVEVGTDGRVWAATATSGKSNDVFVRPAAGGAFQSTGLVHATAWWKSLRAAPSDANRIYVTGYQVAGEAEPTALLRRSDDGGASWITLPVADFAFGSQPEVFIAGVHPANPDILFARVRLALSPVGDAIYRSADKGVSWTKVAELRDFITAFAILSDGSVIVGSISDGALLSQNDGITFEKLPAPPKMSCASQAHDGSLLACGSNWEPDNFALGSTTDNVAWSKLTAFSDIAGPLSCPTGTVQRDTCTLLRWPAICEQFGVCGGGTADAGEQPDGAPSSIDASVVGKPPTGCDSGCQTGGSGALFLLLPWVRRSRSARQ